jgi:hypothetical protein
MRDLGPITVIDVTIRYHRIACALPELLKISYLELSHGTL